MSAPEGSGDPYLPASGNRGYRVTHYDLTLDARPMSGRLAGTAELTAVATQDMVAFALDLASLRVLKVRVNGRRVARYSHSNGKLRIRTERPIAAGATFTVEVRYAGNPEPVRTLAWGELGWDQLTDGFLVASQPIGAPSWFPCNDQPGDKASYRCTITAPAGYTVVASGALVERRPGAGSVTWVYDQPAPTATYLATVQIGLYETVDMAPDPVPQLGAVPARLLPAFGVDFARQPRMLRVFTDLFGPYPFDRYAVVVTDDELEVPVEAQGVSVFGANHVDGQRGFERLVAHELAHQWFGNSLTVAQWRHIWLNEGFACYAEWLWSEFSGGQPATIHAAAAHARLATLPQDLVLADPGIDGMFDDRLYKRGALTLHTLRTVTGDATFFGLLRAWVAAHRHATVDTAAFLDHVATVAGPQAAAPVRRWLFDLALPDLGA